MQADWQSAGQRRLALRRLQLETLKNLEPIFTRIRPSYVADPTGTCSEKVSTIAPKATDSLAGCSYLSGVAIIDTCGFAMV
jgi:hypothetical protein